MAVRAIGLELSLSTQIEGLNLRGIIDRLELRNGELVVTDYKTGRPPSVNWELRSLSGVRFYALLCKQVFGRMPAAIRLMYLSTGEIIEATPSEQATRFVATRTAAVWKAVERACVTGDFQPRPTGLCELCAFRPWSRRSVATPSAPTWKRRSRSGSPRRERPAVRHSFRRVG